MIGEIVHYIPIFSWLSVFKKNNIYNVVWELSSYLQLTPNQGKWMLFIALFSTINRTGKPFNSMKNPMKPHESLSSVDYLAIF